MEVAGAGVVAGEGVVATAGRTIGVALKGAVPEAVGDAEVTDEAAGGGATTGATGIAPDAEALGAEAAGSAASGGNT